jgi:type IV pilus assembly protein PilA
MQDLESNNKKNFPLWGKFLIGFGVIGILSAIALPSFFNQASKAKATFAKMNIAIAVKVQQENYNKTGRFVTSWDELSTGMRSSDDNYEYQVYTRGSNAFTTATPKRDGLISFTGFTFHSGSDTAVTSVICQTLQPSRTPPQIDDTPGAVVCPPGSDFVK